VVGLKRFLFAGDFARGYRIARERGLRQRGDGLGDCHQAGFREVDFRGFGSQSD
jgi:hypothetical protein